MDLNYILGVVTALFCGACMQTGILLQKKVVNDMPPEEKERRFLRTLLKNPRWLTGLLLEYGLGTISFMTAQSLIGPALGRDAAGNGRWFPG